MKANLGIDAKISVCREVDHAKADARKDITSELPLSGGTYTIQIDTNPTQPTGFTRGTPVTLGPDLKDKYVVIGENDTYLNLINIETGDYVGVFKAPENLAAVRPLIGIGVADVQKD